MCPKLSLIVCFCINCLQSCVYFIVLLMFVCVCFSVCLLINPNSDSISRMLGPNIHGQTDGFVLISSPSTLSCRAFSEWRKWDRRLWAVIRKTTRQMEQAASFVSAPFQYVHAWSRIIKLKIRRGDRGNLSNGIHFCFWIKKPFDSVVYMCLFHWCTKFRDWIQTWFHVFAEAWRSKPASSFSCL